VREVVPDEWQALRDIRLAALTDAPSAFGSTYAREAPFAEDQWRTRTTCGGRGAMFFAELPELTEPAGIAGALVQDDGTVEVVSMWVRPNARGHKVGEALITAVAEWARSRDHDALYLWVTESNAAARRLYERCGFTATGERQPLPSDSALPEIRMRRAL